MRKVFYKLFWEGWPTLFVIGYIFWFIFWMSPLVVVDSRVESDGTSFIHFNMSYKTTHGLIFCNRKPESYVYLIDKYDNKVKLKDTPENVGQGHNSVTTWKFEAPIPKILEPGEIQIYKDLTYKCMGLNKIVLSPIKTFTKKDNTNG